MIDKIAKGFLVIILTATVFLGAYLGFNRYLIELQDRTVELCVDLNDLISMAAYEQKSLGPILDAVKERGITSIGLFEVNVPDANALGEIYCTKGSAIHRLGNFYPELASFAKRGLIKPERTYIYAPSAQARKRVYDQLGWVLGKSNIKFIGQEILELNEAEKEIREVGLGISEIQKNFLLSKGFAIVPRVWNDPRYHFGNVDLKISELKEFETIIFDGEDIIGYPTAIKHLAKSLKKNKIKYGYIEIVKQAGDKLLRKLMGRDVIRVHSVPKRELRKLTKSEVIKRFVRAAKERKVRLIYIRPFLPPQIEAYPVAYNLDYFGKVKYALENNGFIVGQAGKIEPLRPKGWQILALGIGVIIGGLFLLHHLFGLRSLGMYFLLLIAGGGILFAGTLGYTTMLQKGLALLATIIFPALAVVSTFAKKPKEKRLPWGAILIVLNVVAESMIGVFLLIGLLADHRFMLGVETFRGVKLALIVPIMLVALYFILKQGEGSLRERLTTFLNTDVKMKTIFLAVFILGALFLLIARSGNFILPVLNIEKYFRNILETILVIRPRTKEFLIGYPLLFLAATALLQGKKKWLWLLAALGAIAPISILNTFSHIHTPLLVSLGRTVNGLILGVLIGSLVIFLPEYIVNKIRQKP